MPYPVPDNEAERLDALRRYQILDTEPEQAFDDFTQLASYICGKPMALVSLIDKERQWFKSRVGVDKSETPREQAFCAHTVMGDDVMVVEDATQDARFAKNPLVTEDMHLRFYAGAPLIDHEGYRLGALCVMDREPGQLDSEQDRALEALARQVVAQLELRRASAGLAKALQTAKVLHGLLPICAHCKSIRSAPSYWEKVDAYISANTDAVLSHGICPDCLKKHYPDQCGRVNAADEGEGI